MIQRSFNENREVSSFHAFLCSASSTLRITDSCRKTNETLTGICDSRQSERDSSAIAGELVIDQE